MRQVGHAGEEYGEDDAEGQGPAQVDAEGGGAGEDGRDAAHAFHAPGLAEEELLHAFAPYERGGDEPGGDHAPYVTLGLEPTQDEGEEEDRFKHGPTEFAQGELAKVRGRWDEEPQEADEEEQGCQPD